MKHIYEVFEITEKLNIPDVFIGLAHFIAENPDVIPMSRYHEYRKFISRHYHKLVDAFKAHDKEAFEKVVNTLVAMEADAKNPV